MRKINCGIRGFTVINKLPTLMRSLNRRIGMEKGHKFKCGCIAGHYWCAKHDIYNKQDPKDPPPHRVTDYPKDYKTEGCSCHISPPCSFCVNSTEIETTN